VAGPPDRRFAAEAAGPPDRRFAAGVAGPPGRRFAAEAADAEAHRRDAPRFCPACAVGLAIVTEFWEADERRFHCACTGCGWAGEITRTGARAWGDEPER
jgi:hypothetical protein